MNILLVTHILCALTSLAISGYAFLQPSRSKVSIATALAVVTLGTGTYLVWTHPAHAAGAVVSGITYLALVLTGIIAAERKLRAQAHAAD